MTDRTMNTDRLRGLLEDPDLGGDLLLVGIGLLAIRDLGRRDLRKLSAMEQALWAGRPGPLNGLRVKLAIVDDARTYRPVIKGHDAPCELPTPRKAQCGRRAGGGAVWLVDYATGERAELRYCSKHRDQAWARHRANRAAAPDPEQPWGGAPLPAANHGGVLRRHFPEFDWPKLWRAYAPRWVEHPEVEPWPKPTLTLLAGDDEAADHTRPLLSLATSGP